MKNEFISEMYREALWRNDERKERNITNMLYTQPLVEMNNGKSCIWQQVYRYCSTFVLDRLERVAELEKNINWRTLSVSSESLRSRLHSTCVSLYPSRFITWNTRLQLKCRDLLYEFITKKYWEEWATSLIHSAELHLAKKIKQQQLGELEKLTASQDFEKLKTRINAKKVIKKSMIQQWSYYLNMMEIELSEFLPAV